MLIAATYCYLAIFRLEFLLSTLFPVILGPMILGSYLIFATRFWFKIARNALGSRHQAGISLESRC